ncbi:MAG: hypothetical protein LAO08_08515 [Acidobacteriia bacterium]|nr:hypothetical protein [Terriglobia bacterium]
MRVFLSVGATYSEEQEHFVRGFEGFLIQSGCERLTVGRGMYGAKQPIQQTRELMETADAVVVLGFTRILVNNAVEKPGSKDQKEITNTKYPTIWNQLEASMAYALKLPLLIILEEGLHQEAMLKDRLEFRVCNTILNPDFFSSNEFRGIFADFKRIAIERALGRNTVSNVRSASLTIGDLVRDLRPDQLWGAGAAVFSLLAALAAAGFWLGKNLH